MIQLGQQGYLHTKTVELEKIKRNRSALDIKSRFVFIYEEALVYHLLIQMRTTRKDFEIVKVHFVTRGTRVGKHTGLSGVRGMFSEIPRCSDIWGEPERAPLFGGLPC